MTPVRSTGQQSTEWSTSLSVAESGVGNEEMIFLVWISFWADVEVSTEDKVEEHRTFRIFHVHEPNYSY
jgi:hypothetical protein